MYEDQLTAVFEQKWITAANGTSVGNTDAVLSSWPMFGMPNSETITGYLHFAKSMLGDGATLGPIAGLTDEAFGLQDTAPLGLFNQNDNDTVVISAFSSFMSANVHNPRAQGGALYCGQPMCTADCKDTKDWCPGKDMFCSTDGGAANTHEGNESPQQCQTLCQQKGLAGCNCYEVKDGSCRLFKGVSLLKSSSSGFTAFSPTSSNPTPLQPAGLHLGMMGGVTSVPGGHSLSFIVSLGSAASQQARGSQHIAA